MTTLRKIVVRGTTYDLGLSEADYQKLSNLDSSVFVVVKTLPSQPLTSNIGKIHVSVEGAAESASNTFTEYLWIPEQTGGSSGTIAAHWEVVGQTSPNDVDMNSYATKKELYTEFDGFTEGDYSVEPPSTDLTRDKLLVLFDSKKGTFVFKEKGLSVSVKYYSSSSKLNDSFFREGLPANGPKTNLLYKYGNDFYVFDKIATSLSEAYSKDRVISISKISDLDRYTDIGKNKDGGIFMVQNNRHSVGTLKMYLSGAGHQIIQQFDATFKNLDNNPSAMESDFGIVHRWIRVYNSGSETAEGLPTKGSWSKWTEFKGGAGSQPVISGDTITFN